MLVAPPASLKSTIIKQLQIFPNALVLSDVNVQQLLKIRDDIANKQYSTLALLELEKIYQRHEDTASNVEGHIKAMVDEGFLHGASEDQRMVTREARAFVIAGLTQNLYKRKYERWLNDGFARRFLWCHYILSDPDVIMRAIHKWEPLELAQDPIVFGLPKNTIPYSLNAEESSRIKHYLRFYKDAETPYILLKRVACVLKWRHKKQPRRAMEIMEDFSECLAKQGAEVDV